MGPIKTQLFQPNTSADGCVGRVAGDGHGGVVTNGCAGMGKGRAAPLASPQVVADRRGSVRRYWNFRSPRQTT